MQKFFIKIGLIFSAAMGLFIWFRSDASVLAGAHPLGLDDASGWVTANSQNPAVLDTLEGANAGMLRVEIPWEMVEKSPGAFSWTYEDEYGVVDLENVFSRLQRRGVKPVAVLSGGPAYLSHLYPQQPVYQEQLLESLRRFAEAAAEYFGDDVDYWQIGTMVNDPNAWGKVLFPLADAPQANPDPVLYSEMLRTAYQAIKGKDAHSTILMGDLVFSADCRYHPNNFLQGIKEQDAWYAFDIVNIQLPALAAKPETAVIDTCGMQPLTVSGVPMADSVRAVSDHLKESGEKPLWAHNLHYSPAFLAEAADDRATIMEAAASDLLARASALLRTYGGAERVFWRFAPLENTPGLLALQTYANLSDTLTGRFESNGLPENLDTFSLRFSSGGKIHLLAWFVQGGDETRVIAVNGLKGYEAVVFSADSDSLKKKDGIALVIDDNGQSAFMGSERPALISARAGDIKQAVTQTVEDSAAQARAGLKAKVNNWMQAEKAKAAARLSGWVADQQASLLNSLRASLEAWLRKSLGLI